MANWLMRPHDAHAGEESGTHAPSRFERLRSRFVTFVDRLIPFRKAIGITYLIGITLLAVLFIENIGTDVLPRVNSSQFQLRIRAPYGTRLERTEEKVRTILKEIENIVGEEHISISSVYVGQHPALFSINPIYLFMAGPHEAVFQIALKDYDGDMNEFKDKVRDRVKEILPDVEIII